MNASNELQKQTESRAAAEAAPQSPGPVHRPRYTSRYDEEAWLVSVELPGVRKEDVRALVENEVLEIVAVRRLETPETWRSLGRYETERRWRLRLDVGPEVDEARISASLEDGVLSLRLPLREEVKPRTVEIH